MYWIISSLRFYFFFVVLYNILASTVTHHLSQPPREELGGTATLDILCMEPAIGKVMYDTMQFNFSKTHFLCNKSYFGGYFNFKNRMKYNSSRVYFLGLIKRRPKKTVHNTFFSREKNYFYCIWKLKTKFDEHFQKLCFVMFFLVLLKVIKILIILNDKVLKVFARTHG